MQFKIIVLRGVRTNHVIPEKCTFQIHRGYFCLARYHFEIKIASLFISLVTNAFEIAVLCRDEEQYVKMVRISSNLGFR